MVAKKPVTVKETPREKQLRAQLDAVNKAYAAAEAKGNRALMKKLGAKGRDLWRQLYGSEGINGVSSEEIGCGDRPCDQCKGDEEAIREAGGRHL
jgi:hypothetical protein